MWLRAFCPQACYAGGPGPFRYLLYKDVNRQVRLTGRSRAIGRVREPMGVSERMSRARRAAAASEPFDLVVRGERVLVGGEFVPAEVGVRGGVIVARSRRSDPGLAARARTVELADDEVLIPGLVDTHVHVNEPGRTEWEGFASATRAAAAGGVTTIVDMPLNSIPPTTTVDALAAEARGGRGRGVRRRRVLGRRRARQRRATSCRSSRAGVFGFKCFLVHSGVDEFPPVTRRRAWRRRCGARRGRRLADHRARRGRGAHRRGAAPAQRRLRRLPRVAAAARPRAPRSPRSSRRAARTGVRAHILHLSDGRRPRPHRRREAPRGAPHRRDLPALPDAHAPRRCPTERPPTSAARRSARPATATRSGAASSRGRSTSSSPTTRPRRRRLKFAGDGDFAEAWGGIASVQLGLPLVWTEARGRGIALARVVEWMSRRRPAASA